MMMLAAPLALAALLGLAFGGSEGYSITAVKVAVVNLDDGASAGAAGQSGGDAAGQSPAAQNLGRELVSILQGQDLSELLSVEEVASEAEARARVDEGQASVAVIIPEGFSRAALSETGEEASVALYQNPAETLGPSIVQGIVQQLMDQFNGARAAAAAAVQVGVQLGKDQASLGQAAAAAAAAFISGSSAGSETSLDFRDPQVSGPAERQPGVAGIVLSGMMVFFIFMVAGNVARTILDEDFLGTLPRLFTTPARKSAILAGKYLAVFLTVLAQGVILLLAGWLIFRINWGAFLPVALLAIAGAAAAAGLAVLLISFLRTPAQAGAIQAGVVVILGLLGGNFVGTAVQGGFFGAVRRFTPNGWLLEAWDKTMRGGQVGDIVTALLVVLGFAAVTFTIGVLLLRRRYA